MPNRNIQRLFASRALRGFADGLVTVLLAKHLAQIGLSEFQIGSVITGTLLGSAAMTLLAGVWASRWGYRRVLLIASVLMGLTGVGFYVATSYWPLLAIAVIGTLNPSAGDVSMFLPTEQTALSEAASDRTFAFARYNVFGNLAGALGSLASGPLDRFTPGTSGRSAFLIYAAIGLTTALLYRGLPETTARSVARVPLRKSRRVVLRLALLFSLDSAGGGFVVQSLLALWLFQRFGLSIAQTGAVFFGTGVLAAFSQLLSSRVARRIGLIPTMVAAHLPANALLVLAAFMPNAPLAITLLLLRMCIAQMDVPARQAYVMNVVPPEERAAAASVTNVPRSLATATTPLLAGWLLSKTSFGWPLVLGGSLKILYDLLLLWQFKSHRPEHEDR
ncbi:MAG TPA: MFS transporter [Polyangiales bacterium]